MTRMPVLPAVPSTIVSPDFKSPFASASVMMPKVNGQYWDYVFNPKKAVWKKKDIIMQPIEDLIGFKIGEYRNYKLIK